MSALLKLALHDVPAPESVARVAEQRVADLSAVMPSLLSCRLTAERAGSQFEVHVELLFPERQVVFNRLADTPEAAVTDALAGLSKRKLLPLAA